MPGSAGGAQVRVFVRLRPLQNGGESEIFDISPVHPRIVTIKDPLSSGRCEHSYEFADVFLPHHNQEHVFLHAAKFVVDGALRGKSGCVLAYGQTGSGKTHTIFGSGSGDERGVLSRSVETIFAAIKERQGGPSGAAMMVSFFEIYQDEVHDLGTRSPGLQGHVEVESPNTEDGCRGATADGGQSGSASDSGRPKGVTKSLASHPADLHRIVEAGFAKRATSVRTGRSHIVLTLHMYEAQSSGTCQSGPTHMVDGATSSSSSSSATVSFVDLAGSERVAKCRADGPRFQEAVVINSALTALEKVILSLASDPRMTKHVPCRDSKLTRTIASSLSSGAHVSLLATINPSAEDYAESLNTLSFADRCKSGARQPQVSYMSSKKLSQLRICDLQKQVDELRKTLQESRSKAAVRGVHGNGYIDLVSKFDDFDVKLMEGLSSSSLGMAQGQKGGAMLSHRSVKLHAHEAGGYPTNVGAQSDKAEPTKSVAALATLQEAQAHHAHERLKAESRIEAAEHGRKSLAELDDSHVRELVELSVQIAPSPA